MAACAESVAGGFYGGVSVGSIHDHDMDSGEGDSLLNLLHTKQTDCRLMIELIIQACSVDSYNIEIDDSVYVGVAIFPSIVLGRAFDKFEREVRVRVVRVFENLTTKSKMRESLTYELSQARWVRTDLCYKLQRGDTLMVIKEFVDASVARKLIPGKTQCTYIGTDEEGDFHI